MPKIKIDESPFDRRKILLNADSNSVGRPGEPYVRNVHSRPEDVAFTGGGGSFGTVSDGLMSGANGSLDVLNMGVTDFRIQDIHIMPEQASYARMESFEDTSTLSVGSHCRAFLSGGISRTLLRSVSCIGMSFLALTIGRASTPIRTVFLVTKVEKPKWIFGAFLTVIT